MKILKRTFVMAGLLALATASMAESGASIRESLTSQGQGITRGRTGDGQTTFDEYGALQTDGGRLGKSLTKGQQKTAGSTAQAASSDFWFYQVDLVLFGDFDRDGYYHGIDLLFDADTLYAVADVYAVIYLSYEYGPWNEYAVTDDFTLFGSSSSDEYIVETELVSGYPSGNYDILIELFDASNDMFLTSIGPDDTSELAILPLEDQTRDSAVVGSGTQVVVNSGGGGSLSWWFLLSVLLAVRMTLRPQAARLSK